MGPRFLVHSPTTSPRRGATTFPNSPSYAFPASVSASRLASSRARSNDVKRLALGVAAVAANFASCDRNVDRARAELPTRITSTIFLIESLRRILFLFLKCFAVPSELTQDLLALGRSHQNRPALSR